MCLFSGKCGLEQNGFSNICWLLHCLSTQFEYGINICFFCSWDCVKFRCLHQNDTGWWFGTFSIFHNIWDNPSHWFSYFSRWWLQHQPDMFQKTWKTRLKNIRLSSEHQIRIMEIVRQQKPEVLRVYTKNCWNVKASLTYPFFLNCETTYFGVRTPLFLDIPIICIRTIMNM